MAQVTNPLILKKVHQPRERQWSYVNACRIQHSLLTQWIPAECTQTAFTRADVADHLRGCSRIYLLLLSSSMLCTIAWFQGPCLSPLFSCMYFCLYCLQCLYCLLYRFTGFILQIFFSLTLRYLNMVSWKDQLTTFKSSSSSVLLITNSHKPKHWIWSESVLTESYEKTA